MAYTISLSARPGCFAGLPPGALVSPADSSLPPVVSVHTSDSRELYVACDVSRSAPPGRVVIHRLLVRALRLEEGQLVSLSRVQPPACRRAQLCTDSDSDYQLLEISSSQLQDSLLDRLGVVWPGARLPIWLDARNVVLVTVRGVQPPQCCRLVRMTELEIVPPAAGSASEPTVEKSPAEEADSAMTRLRRMLRLSVAESRPTSPLLLPEWSLRVHRSPTISGLSASATFLANRVCLCLSFDIPAGGSGWCEATPLLPTDAGPPALVYVAAVDSLPEGHPLRAEVEVAVDNLPEGHPLRAEGEVAAVSAEALSAPGAVLVPDNIRRQLRLCVGERLRLRRISPPSDGDVKHVTLVWPAERLSNSAVTTVQHSMAGWQSCCNARDVWWRSGALLRLTDELTMRQFDVIVESGSQVFRVAAPLTVEFAVSCVSAVCGGQTGHPWPLAQDALDQLSLPPPPGQLTRYTSYRDEEDRIQAWCRRALLHPGLGHVLLSGASGVGKTSLVNQVCRRLSEEPLCVHTSCLDCSSMLGKKHEALMDHVTRLLDTAERRRPSVLVLDSLDALIPADWGSPDQQPSQRAAYFSQLATTLRRALLSLTERRSAVVVVAVAGAVGLHPELHRPRAQHVFGLEVTLAAAGLDGRAVQLQQLCGDEARLSQQQWRRVAEKCRNCVARDLRTLVTRARVLARSDGADPAAAGDSPVTKADSHRSISSSTRTSHPHRDIPSSSTVVSSPAKPTSAATTPVVRASPPTITYTTLLSALQDFTPSALHQLQQQRRPSAVSWCRLGGLSAARRQLSAWLLPPLRHPRLVARAGCRLLPRALLYGAPGTGKTLLATVMADNADVNLFTVKGPELLSKYIGASEQAVRDLFEKAARASPSMIFFDEFESLAPRRGHDSTGVTDRVVNQLLTLLDGAESPAGGGQVAVLAATSRPDLLDPALLRPGRIGRLIRCPLPGVEDREDILRALTSDVSVCEDVKWGDAALRTEGLTGADLKALVTDSQLRAVRETLSDVELMVAGGGRRPGDEDDVAITQIAGPPMDKDELRVVREHTLFSGERVITGSDHVPSTSNTNQTASPPAIAQRHIEAALAELRPSLSAAERNRYQALYERFERDRGAAPRTQHETEVPRQRVSLA